MSLIRSGIVVACGIALLPADKAQQEHILNQAVEATNWAVTYCDREPAKCDQAANLWDGVKEKALIAGRLALEATQTYAAGPALEARPQSAALVAVADRNRAAAPVLVNSRDTLKREDLTPAWRGPKAR